MTRLIPIGVLLALALQSCFTGVESTPRITERELKRQNVTVTPEQSFLTDVAAPRPADWRPGRRLLVTDSRLSHVLTPGDIRVEVGDTLVCRGFASVPTARSRTDLELRFSRGSDRPAYRPATDFDALDGLQRLDIPYTVDLQLVDELRRRLAGKSYYTVTQLWYDPQTFEAVPGTKYTPVRVVDVRPGTDAQPFAVVFDTEDGRRACVLMTVGNGVLAVRNFHTLFSFTDIRDRYPQTGDANWALITRGRVAAGMNMQECRLALGSPEQVIHGSRTESTLQRWSYPDGVYLIFDDGILTKFRQ